MLSTFLYRYTDITVSLHSTLSQSKKPLIFSDKFNSNWIGRMLSLKAFFSLFKFRLKDFCLHYWLQFIKFCFNKYYLIIISAIAMSKDVLIGWTETIIPKYFFRRQTESRSKINTLSYFKYLVLRVFSCYCCCYLWCQMLRCLFVGLV